MPDRRRFIETLGSGIISYSASSNLPFGSGIKTQESEKPIMKKPFILKELPSNYPEDVAKIRIGMCQVFTEEWAIEDNIKRTLEAIDLAANQGAEIAVTPECVFHGYASDKSNGKSEAFKKRLFEIAELSDGKHLQLFKDKAKDKRIHILVGFVARGDNGQIHNTAALISPEGSFVYLYRKIHCRHFENINHWGYFTPGENFYSSSITLKGGLFNIGTMICFDREVPESLRCLRALGSEIVLCPLATSTSDMTICRNKADNEMITRVGATCNEQFVVVVNHAGRFNGGSFIVGPTGELFCQMTDEPGVLTYDVPVGIISRKFHNVPLGWMGWGYRRPDIYSKYI